MENNVNLILQYILVVFTKPKIILSNVTIHRMNFVSKVWIFVSQGVKNLCSVKSNKKPKENI